MPFTSSITFKSPRSADWKDGCKARNNESSKRTDDVLEGEIKDALTRFPSFGYKRVTAVVNRKRRQEEKHVVNAKRVYRVARERQLLLKSARSAFTWLQQRT